MSSTTPSAAERYKEFKNWVRDTEPNVGRACKKMHEMWKEGTEQEAEFNSVATDNDKYVYYH